MQNEVTTSADTPTVPPDTVVVPVEPKVVESVVIQEMPATDEYGSGAFFVCCLTSPSLTL